MHNTGQLKKGEYSMTEHERPLGHLFVGLLIGGTLGALAGVLFAPKSRKELRSEIKEKGSAVLKDAKIFMLTQLRKQNRSLRRPHNKRWS